MLPCVSCNPPRLCSQENPFSNFWPRKRPKKKISGQENTAVPDDDAMSELSETAQKRKAKAAIQKRKAKAAARFDPARFGKKKELKRLDLREFEELNLSPNGIVIMLLESSARKAAQYKECSAMRAGVEREMRNLRAQKAELVAQRMGLRKFKQKKGGAGTALPTLPPVLRRALEPAPGPATLKRDAGTGAGPLPAPSPPKPRNL